MTADHDYDGARMFARIARELAEQPDLRLTGGRVVALATALTGCDEAATWALNQQGMVCLRAATDRAVAEAHAQVIASTGEGLAWQCLHRSETVVMGDLQSERRWPAWRAAGLRSAEPFLSAVGYPLGVRGQSIGALVLASYQPGHFTDELVGVGALLAEHAAIALAEAASAERGENLELALKSNRRIGMAVGILMAARRCTEEQAFDLLRLASQQSHEKLRDVADQVVFTGALPDMPAQPLAQA